MVRNRRFALSAVAVAFGSLAGSPPAPAAVINDLFVFGDSYSDTGAFHELSNGPTWAGYLAQDFGITLTTSKNPDPGTDGVNFAESGARVFVGPTPPATQPRSLTQQVSEFQNDVTSDKVTFNPDSTLFFIEGGGNDHTGVTPAVTAGEVGGIKWSSQHLDGSRDEHSKTALGSFWAGALVLTRSTAGGRARGAAAILGSDCGGRGE
jgi:phospholipase/lecithinase/hemolysin